MSALKSQVHSGSLSPYLVPQSSPVHGILQARILEWVAIPFSRGSSWLRDQTQISHIAGRFFTVWATRQPLCYLNPWSYLFVNNLTWRFLRKRMAEWVFSGDLLRKDDPGSRGFIIRSCWDLEFLMVVQDGKETIGFRDIFGSWTAQLN